MFNSLDTLLIFTILAAFNLWGGAAIGAGIRGRRALPVLWGILIGGAPLYFGIERLVTLSEWLPLACQLACLVGAALAVGLALPRVRAFFLHDGHDRADDRHVHHGGCRSVGRLAVAQRRSKSSR